MDRRSSISAYLQGKWTLVDLLRCQNSAFKIDVGMSGLPGGFDYHLPLPLQLARVSSSTLKTA